ncbi:major facilitator superfamily domain-containing protein [Pholiota molesta]|nr:major facilitator superfamily domain-containing protein [Pholiota molesta]
MTTPSLQSPSVVDYTRPAYSDLEILSKNLSPVYAPRPDVLVPSNVQDFTRQVDSEITSEDNQTENTEFKLPSLRSLFIILGGNALFQVSFFIVVSSASVYTQHLGGTAIFAGLTIGIPTIFSGIGLIFITRLDGKQYAKPLNIAYSAAILGNIIYALAYRVNWLYMILLGRIVSGFGFIAFLYSKRYCSDGRIVGIRQRTTLAGWLIIGQTFGFSTGPFFGGLLYKIGFKNRVFNGVTSPGWVMAMTWVIFGALSALIFEDVPPQPHPEPLELIASTTPPNRTVEAMYDHVSSHQWRRRTSPPTAIPWKELRWTTGRQRFIVIVCMCYFAMTCFFVLNAWEANIPIFTAKALGYSPYDAGNLIALGGISSFPFLLLNIRYARRIQDRVILAVGTLTGAVGLLIMLSTLLANKVTVGSLFICWFLIALGFNLASTCTLSLLSKQLPDTWNGRISLAIQYSNTVGRVTGSILGGAGVKMGMVNYAIVQIVVVGVGGVMYVMLWRQLKAKTG